MHFHYTKAPDQVARFLEVWPLERVKQMTLEDYNGYNDPETFCRWLEIHTISAGSIRGANSYKFEIYKRRPGSRPAKDNQYLNDEVYSWRRRAGENRDVAYQTTKSRLLDIINASANGDFEAVEEIVFTPIAKWKLAFIYSNARTLAIYDHHVLRKIAAFKGMVNAHKVRVYELHEYLLSIIPPATEVYRYSYDLWMEYVIQLAPDRKYWLIGSKYGKQAEIDHYHDFKESEMVATGFHESIDLTNFYNKPDHEIRAHLRNRGEPNKNRSYSAVSKFLQLKPGDIVAIKSSGTPHGKSPNLSIHALAKVVERDGEVYHYNPNHLAHCVHVEFFEEEFKSLKIGGYNQTIAEIKDAEKIDKIFGDFLPDNDDKVHQRIRNKRRRRRGTRHINQSPHKRRGHGDIVTNSKHNEIQSQFYEYLVQAYGQEGVLMEKNFVDIEVKTEEGLVLYEVKPFAFAEDCIRAALGQLLAYSFHSPEEVIKLVVVGPKKAEKEDKQFIAYIKEQLNVEFEYRFFTVK